jgi:hypothetical protein
VIQKERKRRAGRRAAAGGDVGPMGRCGLKGTETRFSFFLFFFQTQLKPTFKLKIYKPFQTFSQNFINFLDLTQATKNHA